MEVKEGNKVTVEYTGTLEDGTVFDSSDKHEEPFIFEVGAKEVIRGFDQAVIGMKEGEEKNVTIQPEDAYGHPDPTLIKKFPREQLKGDELKKGMTIGLGTEDGKHFPAVVKDIDDESITLDLNPLLAGKVLNFKIKIVEISS